jgi:hypothetical protein
MPFLTLPLTLLLTLNAAAKDSCGFADIRGKGQVTAKSGELPFDASSETAWLEDH